jgi:hypothetical protein
MRVRQIDFGVCEGFGIVWWVGGLERGGGWGEGWGCGKRDSTCNRVISGIGLWYFAIACSCVSRQGTRIMYREGFLEN